MENLDKDELLRLKVIVEWQIGIAKCHRVLEERQKQLKEINKQLENMYNQEFFPPTESELEEMIKILKARLQDNSYQEDWVKIHDELMHREKQLRDLTIKNETI